MRLYRPTIICLLGVTMDSEEMAQMIDHTLLKPNATKSMIKKLCSEAIHYNFGHVCVNPVWVKYASSLLIGKETKTCAVVGFPLGATKSEVKAYEAKKCVEDGASEIDMVMNIGAFLDGEMDIVSEDIERVVEECDIPVKVIIEVAYLDKNEIERASQIVKNSGAAFVKTSTGFGPRGCTAEDVKIMRNAVGKDFGVKAAGGIRNLEKALEMINAGANRIGTSSGVEIMKELKQY